MVKEFFREFRDFLKEYKIVGLAIAFVIGAAATTLIQSLVNNIVMPLITPALPNGEWQKATFGLGSVQIGWGAFLAALINFLIIAFVVFIVAEKLIKKKQEDKKEDKK